MTPSPEELIRNARPPDTPMPDAVRKAIADRLAHEVELEERAKRRPRLTWQRPATRRIVYGATAAAAVLVGVILLANRETSDDVVATGGTSAASQSQDSGAPTTPPPLGGMVASLPLPDGFDTSRIETAGDDAGLAAATATVACEWISQWEQAISQQDEVEAQRAADALATSRQWEPLLQLDGVSDFPETVWHYADLINTATSTPLPLQTPESIKGYRDALVCE